MRPTRSCRPTGTANKFDFENPVNIGYSAGPDYNRYYKYWDHRDMLAAEAVVEEVEARFAEVFGRRVSRHGRAPTFATTPTSCSSRSGSAAGLCAAWWPMSCGPGVRAGMLRIRYLRPMPERRSCPGACRRGGRGRAGEGRLVRRAGHRVH